MRDGLAAALLVGVAACGGERRPPEPPDLRGKITAVELATLEIRADEVDRFEHCPPPGDIGQDWLPPIPEWHAPAASASAAIPESAVAGSGGGEIEPPTPAEPARPAVGQAALVEAAGTQTRSRFRSCYHHALLYDPTQDGHAAFVLRVDRGGHVARVEVWGACDLSHEALACMRDEAAHVKLEPPAAGSATVLIPALFTRGDEPRRSANDGYAAAVYVAIEARRPGLHQCEQTARRGGVSPFATALMTIDVDEKGRGVHVSVDQWKGAQDLLACAAEALEGATFPPPPAGRGRVVVPVAFNPRPFTR